MVTDFRRQPEQDAVSLNVPFLRSSQLAHSDVPQRAKRERRFRDARRHADLKTRDPEGLLVAERKALVGGGLLLGAVETSHAGVVRLGMRGLLDDEGVDVVVQLEQRARRFKKRFWKDPRPSSASSTKAFAGV